MLKLSLWQIWCLWKENSVLNHILWIRMLGVVFMNSKTHMIVMEVVSQNLDEYRINGLISKLHAYLSGQTWVCCLVWFLINHVFIFLILKFLWFILDIQRSSFVKFHDIWMCVDSPFVFYKWGICYWNEQWTTYATPDFEDLIPKLGWMFWAII